MKMNKKINIVKIKFQNSRFGYYKNSMEFPIQHLDYLIVEDDRGEDIGQAIINYEKQKFVEDNVKLQILRKATNEDLNKNSANRIKEKIAYKFCVEKNKELKLQMKLINVEYRLDRKKIIFYFTAENRIDFRELVKFLAAEYKTRIEMRQISPREDLQKTNSIGSCGLPVCCNRFINHFEPVSTQLVKDQNLPMNPSKISGCCGKLKCCFLFEHETYQEFLTKYPPYGTKIKHEDKYATIEKIDIFQETLSLRYDDDSMEDFPLSDLRKTLKIIK